MNRGPLDLQSPALPSDLSAILCYRALQRQLVEEAKEARLSLSRCTKKKKRKRLEAEQLQQLSTEESSCHDTTESDEMPASEISFTPEQAPLRMSPHKDQDRELPKVEEHVRAASAKKRKKKKRDKRKRLIVPEISSDLFRAESQPKIGKIVIVNGTTISSSPSSSSVCQSPTSVFAVSTKIATSSAVSSAASSPITVTHCETASPVMPLRSASPKFSPKNDVTGSTSPFPEDAVPLPQEVSNVIFRERKRKSSFDSSARGILKSSKRKKIVSLNSDPMSALAPTPLMKKSTTSKLNLSLRLKDEPKIKPSGNGVQQQQRKSRESFSGGGGYPAIILSENLKRHLTADFEMVTKKRRLNILPSETCIVTVLEDFVRHYAAGRLVAFEKQQRKSMYTAQKRGEGAGELTYQRALEAIQVSNVNLIRI